MAINQTTQTMLIGIKGTSTLEELLTDCCGRAVRVDLENDPHSCYYPPVDDDGVLGDEFGDNEIGNVKYTATTGRRDTQQR